MEDSALLLCLLVLSFVLFLSALSLSLPFYLLFGMLGVHVLDLSEARLLVSVLSPSLTILF